jgi:hypothetical protein
MAKYLMLWKLNNALVPVSPQERSKAFSGLTSFVQQDMEKKIIKDWGCYVGEGSGYLVAEGTEVDISKMVQHYMPYCQFSTHPIASVHQINEVLKSMAE